MTKLTSKKRDDLKSLLEEHRLVTDALVNLGKSGFTADVSVNNESGGDFTTVPLRFNIAKVALTEQKAFIESELKKLDIELA